MPATTIKRKESVVKAVRRNAVAHVDKAISALAGPGDDRLAVSERELRRLLALLELVRRPLGGEVYRREKRGVVRALKVVAPASRALRIAALRSLAKAPPAVEVEGLIDQMTASANDKPPREAGDPDPKVLRLLADLAEMRMRARYWHLPAGEFELLRPGLRASYARVKKLSVGPATHAAAEAWGVWADQLQAIERAWPALLVPLRKDIRSAERGAKRRAIFAELAEPTKGHEVLTARLGAETAATQPSTEIGQACLLAESPAAYVKRLEAYWAAWRGLTA